jgi:hypothetical protein
MTYAFYRLDAGGAFACRLAVACAVLALALPSAIYANSIVGTPIDWEGVLPTAPWAAQGDDATVAENDAGEDDYLEITFAATSDSSGPTWDEVASGAASDLFAGTWTTAYWIEFEFWAQSVNPGALQIRWAGTASEHTWGNTITPTASVGSWGSLRTDPFSDLEAWRLEDGLTAGDLLADLESIDWIGVYIFRDGTDLEVYGVDDFQLMVPEPAEYVMLAMALVTAVLAMRGRKLLPVSVRLA